jgi:hypothetical protein
MFFVEHNELVPLYDCFKGSAHYFLGVLLRMMMTVFEGLGTHMMRESGCALVWCLSRDLFGLRQRFSNFFQVGTTFISQNVLRTTLLLSP